MPLNLTKKYNDLLDLLGMPEKQRTESLRIIFNRDIENNPSFTFNGNQYIQHQWKMGELPWRTFSIILPVRRLTKIYTIGNLI